MKKLLTMMLCTMTILSLAAKLQNGNMKEKGTLMEVINELSSLTGKSISDDKKENIEILEDFNFDNNKN